MVMPTDLYQFQSFRKLMGSVSVAQVPYCYLNAFSKDSFIIIGSFIGDKITLMLGLVLTHILNHEDYNTPRLVTTLC